MVRIIHMKFYLMSHRSFQWKSYQMYKSNFPTSIREQSLISLFAKRSWSYFSSIKFVEFPVSAFGIGINFVYLIQIISFLTRDLPFKHIIFQSFTFEFSCFLTLMISSFLFLEFLYVVMCGEFIVSQYINNYKITYDHLILKITSFVFPLIFIFFCRFSTSFNILHP